MNRGIKNTTNPCRRCGEFKAELVGNVRKFCDTCKILQNITNRRKYYHQNPKKYITASAIPRWVSLLRGDGLALRV